MIDIEAERREGSTETEVLIVLCTCPDSAEADRLASGLVENDHAACVNVLPEIRSIYRWQGKVHKDPEALVIVKTTRRAFAGLQQWLLRHHPYDVPEILALPVTGGSANYLEWVIRQTAAD